jgi:hypothetical protein
MPQWPGPRAQTACSVSRTETGTNDCAALDETTPHASQSDKLATAFHLARMQRAVAEDAPYPFLETPETARSLPQPRPRPSSARRSDLVVSRLATVHQPRLLSTADRDAMQWRH